MQLCALLTLSSGSFIVSKIESNSTAAYVVAASTMSVVSGVSNAFSGPFSVKIAQSTSMPLAQRVRIFTVFHQRFMLFITFSTVILMILPDITFKWWLGELFGNSVNDLVMPLAIATFLRQITSPYTMAILGLGKQSKIWLSPAVEAGSSVVAGSLFGMFYGPMGVAYGLVIAAAIRLTFTLLYAIRLTTKELPISIWTLIIPVSIEYSNIKK